LVFHVFIFRVYLTFVKAVTLILKHATWLRTSNLPLAAVNIVELDYQMANMDKHIQQYLTACASELSVEQFAGFIMDTNIGLFMLLFVTSISYCPFSVISVLSQYRCIDDTLCILFPYSFVLPLHCFDSYSVDHIPVPLLKPRLLSLL
jgi:hypothetical protein